MTTTATLLVGGTVPSPIVLDNFSRKLDPSNGNDLWMYQDAPFAPASVTVDGADVYVSNEYRRRRLNADTGSVIWSVGCPPNELFAGLIYNGGNLTQILSHISTSQMSLISVDPASGSAIGTEQQPPTEQGVIVTDIAETDSAVIESAKSNFGPFGEWAFRSVDKMTGVTLWDVQIPAGVYINEIGPIPPYIAASNTEVAVVAAVGDNSQGGYWVGVLDEADGSQRWSRSFYEYEQENTQAIGPYMDSHGDIFVLVNYETPCQPYPSTCRSYALTKFSGLDGSTMWSIPTELEGMQPIGDDVLATTFSSNKTAGASVMRLKGSDGSVIWAVPLADSAGSFYPQILPDGNIIFDADDGRHLLSADGDQLWTSALTPEMCNPFCSLYHNLVINGNLIYIGFDDNSALIMLQQLAPDAPVQAIYPFGRAPAGIFIALNGIAQDSTGTLWVRGFAEQRHANRLEFLGKLDPTSGLVSELQTLSSDSNDSISDDFSIGIMDVPSGNHALVSIAPSLSPDPTSNAIALVDTTLLSRGDLSLAMTTHDGAGYEDFQITAHYEGDTPISGARVLMTRDSAFSAENLNCATTNASHCVIFDQGEDYPSATFDADPGGSITLSGRYRVVDVGTATLYASLIGPPSLGEPDLTNNFASAIMPDVIFRDGFQ